MSRTVIILGAGASADFGVPTLAGVFKDRNARRYVASKPDLLGRLNDIFWTPRGRSLESSDASLTIEDMLTVLRDWEQEPKLPAELKPADVGTLRRQLYVLIEQAVFEGKSTRGAHLNPLLGVCRRSFERTTWASFNWDCVFEASFWYSQEWYGPGSRSNPTLAVAPANWYQGDARHRFLKLHGGINWWILGGQLTYVEWSAGGALQRKWREYDADPTSPDRPVILEPSFYKYQDDAYTLLAPQWDEFFARLLDARLVIIVGYSLPTADALARSKILTAFQVNQESSWLVIDPSTATLDRYRQLLGDKRVRFMPTTLSGFNNEVLANLQDAFPGLEFR